MRVRAMKQILLFLALNCTMIFSFEDLQSQIFGGILYSGDINSADLERALQQMILHVQPSRALYDFDTIDQPGIYRLSANVSNQITISASDVTLDMNGGTVS